MHRPHRLACTLVLAALAVAPGGAQRAIIVVRHAERAEVQPGSSNDPPLAAQGEARAERLASMLRGAGVSAIYSTAFRRTLATAQPLAAATKVPVSRMPPTADTLVAMLRAKHPDGVVLVVGHSNTVPEIPQKLGHAEPIAIADDEFDNLFIVVPRGPGAPPGVVRMRY
jgi:broad specificity phosphatase PhoE